MVMVNTVAMYTDIIMIMDTMVIVTNIRALLKDLTASMCTTLASTTISKTPGESTIRSAKFRSLSRPSISSLTGSMRKTRRSSLIMKKRTIKLKENTTGYSKR